MRWDKDRSCRINGEYRYDYGNQLLMTFGKPVSLELVQDKRYKEVPVNQ